VFKMLLVSGPNTANVAVGMFPLLSLWSVLDVVFTAALTELLYDHDSVLSSSLVNTVR
jgi:hypothetical protein